MHNVLQEGTSIFLCSEGSMFDNLACMFLSAIVKLFFYYEFPECGVTKPVTPARDNNIRGPLFFQAVASSREYHNDHQTFPTKPKRSSNISNKKSDNESTLNKFKD